MVDDGYESSPGPCPVIELSGKMSGKLFGTDGKTKIFRVSWIINGIRQERFFSAKSWANTFVEMLIEAADTLECSVTPIVVDVYMDERSE